MKNIVKVTMLKNLVFFLIIVVVCFSSCKNKDADENIESLEGTAWKLVGIVDSKTDKLKELEPKDCEKCYTLTFETYNTFQTFSSSNELQGIYKANYSTQTIQITDFRGTKKGEIGDGYLYWNHDIWYTVQTLSLQENELRLYYNDNKNYLLFKPLKP